MDAISKPAATDALVISLRVKPDAEVSPVSAELRGGDVKMRLSLPGALGMSGVFSKEGRVVVEEALSRLKGVVGVFVMADFEARLPGVTLRECRATIGGSPDGHELVALRFRHCHGDALSLFAPDRLPLEALTRAGGVEPLDVLTDVLMPLFNLRQYLSDFPTSTVAADLDRLNAVIGQIAAQINVIEEGYYARLEAHRGRGAAPEPRRLGLDAATTLLMREAVSAAQAPRRVGAADSGEIWPFTAIRAAG
jgi:hypothetical protein